MTAVGITHFEKPSRDKNIDDCQQIGVKYDKTFLRFGTVDSISNRLTRNSSHYEYAPAVIEKMIINRVIIMVRL